jgi:hypothetical protein
MPTRPRAGRPLGASIFAAVVLVAGSAASSRAATFNYDFGPGCATMSVQGRTITCSDGTTLALHSSVTPGCLTFSLVPQGSAYTLHCATPNATGLWWRADENGRGTWVSHQGDAIFGIDFAYDGAGAPRWRTLIASKGDQGAYTGDVYTTSGPPFQAPTFDPRSVTVYWTGAGSIVLDDADNLRANFFEGSARALVKQQFGPLPVCAFGPVGDPATATNYTDLWWNPGEPGWGVNIAHEGDIIVAAWYTYDTDGSPLWLVVAANKTAPMTYSGDLYRTVGPAGPDMQATKVGTATFTFADGNSATFASTAQLAGMTSPATQAKAITRQIITAPGTTCQ